MVASSVQKKEVLSESYESSEKKTAKKKKNGVMEETTVTTTKTKKSKKSKKSDEKENHISVREMSCDEEISKFNVSQTNMFIENEIYHNNREKCLVTETKDVIVNGMKSENKDEVDKSSPVVNGVASGLKGDGDHRNYENVKVDHGISPVENKNDPFESISDPVRPTDLVIPVENKNDPFESISDPVRPTDLVMPVTSAINYNVKLPTPHAEHIYANEERDSVIYENIEDSVRPKPSTESEVPAEQGVDFDEFDPTVTNTASVPSKPTPPPTFPVKPIEEPTDVKPKESPKSPQIIGVSSKSKFVEPSDQLVFESWTTPDDADDSRIQIIEKSESSQEQEDSNSVSRTFMCYFLLSGVFS
ncbi:uncharacterized protein LOC113470799 [Diaphorina citri]|uniref:Uncharacterized protein LOC113470799 n=1 Tax=Diaphorina citri TaxID=121845 RepID=A0A3Q0JF54_DIACI|nr:uncharacterized protein LOC113470799 [Diaphorina citri]